MDYELFFIPRRSDPDNPESGTVMLPILVAEDGRQIFLTKAVDTVEKALSFYTGFNLAIFIADHGGFDAVEKIACKNSEPEDDGFHPTEK